MTDDAKPQRGNAMRPAAPVLAAAMAAGAIAWTAAATHAADAIRTGKWEFAAQVQLPHLPPGVALPPGLKIGPGGINVTRTACVNQSTLVPPGLHLPAEQHGQCKVEHLERDEGTVRWLVSCSGAPGSVRAEGVAHYTGDKMEATLTTHSVDSAGHAQATSQHVTGRYLGPCDAH
jgi:hypothetical protein